MNGQSLWNLLLALQIPLTASFNGNKERIWMRMWSGSPLKWSSFKTQLLCFAYIFISQLFRNHIVHLSEFIWVPLAWPWSRQLQASKKTPLSIIDYIFALKWNKHSSSIIKKCEQAMKMRYTDAKLLFIDNCDVWSSTPIDRNPVFYNRKKGSSLLLPMQIAMYFLTPLPIIYVFLRKEDNMVQFNQTTTHQESTRATAILLIVKLKL